MESPQVPLTVQEKRGDAKAIATLLNHKLQPKGVTAKVLVKNRYLHIMLEADKPLTQQPIVEFLKKSFAGFSIEGCDGVKVYGRRVGEEIPEWTEEFKLEPEPSKNVAALAKQGDVQAITQLLNKTLCSKGATAKVSLKNECLQIMLEAAESPKQEAVLSLLHAEIERLEIQGINRLRVYGKQTGEDFPDWQEEVKLCAGSEREAALNSSLPPQTAYNSDSVMPQKTDRIALSNQLYSALVETCYQHLSYKVNLEDDKTIHEIVEQFVDGLEMDLRQDLKQFTKQITSVIAAFNLSPEQSRIQAIISDVTAARFAGVRLAIRDLERVTREVLQTNFPQETSALKAFFTGAAQEFTANLSGRTLASQEALIGGAIGSLFAPGIGTVIGSAIGGWLGGNNQQKALEELLEKYQKARDKLFQEWETLLQAVYTELANSLASFAPVSLLTYQVIEQSISLCEQGDGYLKQEPQTAIEHYDKAIQLNPGLQTAWNNKSFALNNLKKFEEALPVAIQATRLDPTHPMSFCNYGYALQKLERCEEAIAVYKQSIQLEPDNYLAWYGIAECFYELQQFVHAIEAADKLIAIDPKNFYGWYAKASCLCRTGDSQRALESLEAAVKLNPEMCRKSAKTDSDFDLIRDEEEFKVLMESSVGVSYAALKQYLEQKQWREADQETARLIKQVIRNVSNSSEITQEALRLFPCTDLETIDLLWHSNSDGKYGFSVQKKLYQQASKDRNTFGWTIGWRVQDDNGNWYWRSITDFDYDPAKLYEGYLPSSLWAGEDGWLENRRDRLITLLDRLDLDSVEEA